MPFFIIAQSIGDVPTGTFFPMFRRATTLFERVEEDQKTANLQTVGWNRRYITHELKLEEDKRLCSSQANSPIREKLSAEAVWAEDHLKNKFRGLNASEMHFCYGLVLRKVKDDESKNPLNRPDFLPIWVVQTEKNVIANHNDFLNPRFVDFIRPLYFMVERGTDYYLRVRH